MKRIDELQAAVGQLGLQNSLLRQASKLRRTADEELFDAVYTDPVTGVFTRRYFEDEIVPELAAHQYKETRGSSEEIILGFCDVNDLKQLNDVHGHIKADGILRKLAESIDGALSSSTICRYGGDEFVTVTRLNRKQARLAHAHAIEIREAVNTAIEDHCVDENGVQMSYGVSMGLVIVSDYGSVSEAINEANIRMFKDKAATKAALAPDFEI